MPDDRITTLIAYGEALLSGRSGLPPADQGRSRASGGRSRLGAALRGVAAGGIPSERVGCSHPSSPLPARARPGRAPRARPLALDEATVMPHAAGRAAPTPAVSIAADVTADEVRRFERFYHELQRIAWALPCTYGDPAVSIFEQWKAVAALVFASGDNWRAGPAERFTLVGGDIPGIQEFVYTITSKGAAKVCAGAVSSCSSSAMPWCGASWPSSSSRRPIRCTRRRRFHHPGTRRRRHH